tara:strand:+ start:226 stop:450 length:225 start_codon:yes stop_codon:yes gene_type:complete
METIEIILLIVSINLAIRLITNFSLSGLRSKQGKDIKLILAYLENNERDRLEIIRETIPSIEYELSEIKANINL